MISERSKRAGLKELEIFDNFEIDRNLPKYHSENGNAKVEAENLYIPVQPVDPWATQTTAFGTIKFGKHNIKNWLISKLQGKKKSTKKISIVDFFSNVTKSCEELTTVEEIANYYENALKQSLVMGQTALIQKLKDNLNVVKGEAVLIAIGLRKYVTEKQVIDYYQKVGEDKNLKLTWIKNFGRIIPETIYEIKKQIDDRKIFDNYVVLHYDPKDDGTKLTKEEIEKKKDPILFGVIKNSNKLYFIADWKDEYCDLTLEEMFKVLKGKVLEINNKSVKTYISKIKV